MQVALILSCLFVLSLGQYSVPLPPDNYVQPKQNPKPPYLQTQPATKQAPVRPIIFSYQQAKPATAYQQVRQVTTYAQPTYVVKAAQQQLYQPVAVQPSSYQLPSYVLPAQTLNYAPAQAQQTAYSAPVQIPAYTSPSKVQSSYNQQTYLQPEQQLTHAAKASAPTKVQPSYTQQTSYSQPAQAPAYQAPAVNQIYSAPSSYAQLTSYPSPAEQQNYPALSNVPSLQAQQHSQIAHQPFYSAPAQQQSYPAPPAAPSTHSGPITHHEAIKQQKISAISNIPLLPAQPYSPVAEQPTYPAPTQEQTYSAPASAPSSYVQPTSYSVSNEQQKYSAPANTNSLPVEPYSQTPKQPAYPAPPQEQTYSTPPSLPSQPKRQSLSNDKQKYSAPASAHSLPVEPYSQTPEQPAHSAPAHERPYSTQPSVSSPSQPKWQSLSNEKQKYSAQTHSLPVQSHAKTQEQSGYLAPAQHQTSSVPASPIYKDQTSTKTQAISAPAKQQPKQPKQQQYFQQKQLEKPKPDQKPSYVISSANELKNSYNPSSDTQSIYQTPGTQQVRKQAPTKLIPVASLPVQKPAQEAYTETTQKGQYESEVLLPANQPQEQSKASSTATQESSYDLKKPLPQKQSGQYQNGASIYDKDQPKTTQTVPSTVNYVTQTQVPYSQSDKQPRIQPAEPVYIQQAATPLYPSNVAKSKARPTPAPVNVRYETPTSKVVINGLSTPQDYPTTFSLYDSTTPAPYTTSGAYFTPSYQGQTQQAEISLGEVTANNQYSNGYSSRTEQSYTTPAIETYKQKEVAVTEPTYLQSGPPPSYSKTVTGATEANNESAKQATGYETKQVGYVSNNEVGVQASTKDTNGKYKSQNEYDVQNKLNLGQQSSQTAETGQYLQAQRSLAGSQVYLSDVQKNREKATRTYTSNQPAVDQSYQLQTTSFQNGQYQEAGPSYEKIAQGAETFTTPSQLSLKQKIKEAYEGLNPADFQAEVPSFNQQGYKTVSYFSESVHDRNEQKPVSAGFGKSSSYEEIEQTAYKSNGKSAAVQPNYAAVGYSGSAQAQDVRNVYQPVSTDVKSALSAYDVKEGAGYQSQLAYEEKKDRTPSSYIGSAGLASTSDESSQLAYSQKSESAPYPQGVEDTSVYTQSGSSEQILSQVQADNQRYPDNGFSGRYAGKQTELEPAYVKPTATPTPTLPPALYSTQAASSEKVRAPIQPQKYNQGQRPLVGEPNLASSELVSYQDQTAFMPYRFAWNVNDDYGNDFGQQHDSDAYGTSNGEYKVRLPDGRVQTVTYKVTPSEGYTANVKYKIGSAY